MQLSRLRFFDQMEYSKPREKTMYLIERKQFELGLPSSIVLAITLKGKEPNHQILVSVQKITNFDVASRQRNQGPFW